MRRFRGFTFVELMIAMPLILILVGSAVEIASVAVNSFERYRFFAADPAWQSAERLLAFLDIPLKHCGVGLPERWESTLFSSYTLASYIPDWGRWGKPITVGNTTAGYSFRSVTSGWGNTLRLVAAAPTSVKTTERIELESKVRKVAHLSEAVKSDSTVTQTSSVSWLLFPGADVPVRMTSGAASTSPTLEALEDVTVPWGNPVCRLMALIIYQNDGSVYGNFHDTSGSQPLFRNIDALSFKLDNDGKLLTARVGFYRDGSDKLTEVFRTWQVGM